MQIRPTYSTWHDSLTCDLTPRELGRRVLITNGHGWAQARYRLSDGHQTPSYNGIPLKLLELGSTTNQKEECGGWVGYCECPGPGWNGGVCLGRARDWGGGGGRGEERGRSEGELGGVWTESDQNCGQNQLMRQRSVSRSLYTAFSEPVLSAVFVYFLLLLGVGLLLGWVFFLFCYACVFGGGGRPIYRGAQLGFSFKMMTLFLKCTSLIVYRIS